MNIIVKRPDLIFVQETHKYQYRPFEIEKKIRIFTAGNGKHRVAIVIPNNKIDAMLIRETSKEDKIVLEKINEKIKLFAVSM